MEISEYFASGCMNTRPAAMSIETERLVICEFTPDMAEAVHRNSLDEETRRFVPDEVFETMEDAADTIEFLMGCYESGKGPLVYPVLRKDGTNIGYVQAVPMEDGGWEIGYHLGKDYRGCGYAAEALSAFLPVILERLDIREIIGVSLEENTASLRVLERCGFRLTFRGEGDYQGNSRQIRRYLYSK